ncbi:MAG: hypothetical protein JSW07_20175 [bacterium]|nr:MAG: hypothetical protein JSW07_20175 [bacterium]
MRNSTIIMFLLIVITGFLNLYAQDEPLFEKLKKDFNKEYLSVGALLQVVGDFQNERSFSGHNGFNISNFRWRIYGKLDKNFGYFLQTNFINSPAFLDAFITWEINSWLQLKSGLFKAPFSKEYLISASDIDFVNRAQVVNALTVGRQIGVQFSGWLKDKLLNYRVGVFNGNGFRRINNNDNDYFLYVARFAVVPKISSEKNVVDQLEMGINGAVSIDNNVNIPGVYSNFEGERQLLGADIRLTLNKFLVAGEAIFAKFDPKYYSTREPSGFHFTIGYMVTNNAQLLFRFDKFQLDDSNDSTDLIILGYNLWPSNVAEFQANYIINTDESDFKNHQLLLNLQINFN